MKRVKKGQAGYIRYRRTFHLILASVLFIMSIVLYISGIKTTGDNKNLLTIVAIVGLLPASQSCVTTILGFRAKSCSKELINKIEEKIDDSMYSLYDFYFTTYDKNYPVSHIVLKNNCLCGIMNVTKHSTQELEQYIEETFTKNGIKGISVKFFESTMEEKYLKRIDELKKLETTNMDFGADAVRLLGEISY